MVGLERNVRSLQLVAEFLFPLRVGVGLDRIIPRIDVPLGAAVVGQIARRAQKTPPMCISLLKGKYAASALTSTRWTTNSEPSAAGRTG